MKNSFENLAYKFQKFMAGRYGPDQLYRALTWIYLILIIISAFAGRTNRTVYGIFSLLSLAVFAFSVFRLLSRNLDARRKENKKWLELTAKINKKTKLIRNRWKFRKTHVFKKCRSCKAVLRMKRAKGRHKAVCPHCGTEFEFRILF